MEQVFTLGEQTPNLATAVDGGAFHFHQPSFAEPFHHAAHQGRRHADRCCQVLLRPAGVVGAGVTEPEDQTFGPDEPQRVDLLIEHAAEAAKRPSRGMNKFQQAIGISFATVGRWSDPGCCHWHEKAAPHP